MEIPTGKELRNARLDRGMTQNDLAEDAGVSQPLIARIENGDVDPRLDTIHQIVVALNEATLPFDSEEVSVILPEALRGARKRTGYSQGELADSAGVSQPLISRIENDNVNPRASTLQAILGELNIGEREDTARTDTPEEQDILTQLNSEFEDL